MFRCGQSFLESTFDVKNKSEDACTIPGTFKKFEEMKYKGIKGTLSLIEHQKLFLNKIDSQEHWLREKLETVEKKIKTL